VLPRLNSVTGLPARDRLVSGAAERTVYQFPTWSNLRNVFGSTDRCRLDNEADAAKSPPIDLAKYLG
jgi:hypothetical protein